MTSKIVRVPIEVTVEVEVDDGNVKSARLLLESTTRMPDGEYAHDSTWLNVTHYSNFLAQIEGNLSDSISVEAYGGAYI